MARQHYFGVVQALEQICDSDADLDDELPPWSDNSDDEVENQGVSKKQLMSELIDTRVTIKKHFFKHSAH